MQKFTDMTISAEGGKDIPCHRSVLATSSPVLDRMLSSELQEGAEARIVMYGATPEDAQAFIEYLYTGVVPPSTDAMALLRLADMYDVPGLVHTCIQKLESTLSSANIVEVLRSLHVHRESGSMFNEVFLRVLGRARSDRMMLQAVVRHILLHSHDETWAQEIAECVLSDHDLLHAVSAPVFSAIAKEACQKASEWQLDAMPEEVKDSDPEDAASIDAGSESEHATSSEGSRHRALARREGSSWRAS